MLQGAFDIEMQESWDGAFEFLTQDSIPVSCNVIGCYTIYKGKDDAEDGIRLKERNVLNVNRDRDQFRDCRDSASADINVVCLVLSLGVNLGFDFGTADRKGYI